MATHAQFKKGTPEAIIVIKQQVMNKSMMDITEKLVGTRRIRTETELLTNLLDVGRILTLEELRIEKDRIRQDLRKNPQEIIEVDEGAFDVLEASPEIEAEISRILGEKPKIKKTSAITRAELGAQVPKKKKVFKSNMHIGPTSRQKYRMLLGNQHGVDETGVMLGTYHIIEGKFNQTPFVAAHIKPKASFADGLDHWWNEDGTANFRMLNKFANEQEGTSSLLLPERARVTTKLLQEAGYSFNHYFDELVSLIKSSKAEILKFSGKLILEPQALAVAA